MSTAHYYTQHTALTPALWSDYCLNASRTEPPLGLLLHNWGLLDTYSVLDEGETDLARKRKEECTSLDLTQVELRHTTICGLVKLNNLQVLHAPTRLLHAVVGLSTEAAELSGADNDEHYAEELGDLCWYAAIAWMALDSMGVAMDLVALRAAAETLPSKHQGREEGVVSSAFSVVGIAKKVVFYGRTDLREELAQRLAALISHIAEEATQMTNVQSMAVLLSMNSTKLLKGRYASGAFSEAEASARADKGADDDDT